MRVGTFVVATGEITVSLSGWRCNESRVCVCVCVCVAEARGGLHIVEQSLWNAVPSFMRRLSAALKKATGKDLPLSATPFRFGSWMGGDRDGNPNVTAKVSVSCLHTNEAGTCLHAFRPSSLSMARRRH